MNRFLILAALGCAALSQAAVLYDNGMYAVNGAGLSTLDAGYDTFGIVAGGYSSVPSRAADDFTVTGPGWKPTKLVVYGYQTGSVVTPFTRAYVALFKSDPTGTTNLNAEIGGVAELTAATATNRFLGQLDTGHDRGNTTRNITRVEIDLSWVGSLAPGKYWWAVGLRGQADASTVALMPTQPNPRADANGLVWGRTRTGGSREDFWQLADGNLADSINILSPYDYAFQVEGNLVPEPATLAVLGLGTLAALRRRKRG